MKEEDLGMNSQVMWLRGDPNQSLNFQGTGVSPWLQPNMLGMQTDIYQTMAAAALQEMRSIDSSKPLNPTLLHFPQHQSQIQPTFVPENQSQLLQQQLQHQNPFNNQQQNLLSLMQNQSLLNSFSHEETSHLLNMPRSTSMLTSTGWPAKRVAVDPLLVSGTSQSLLHQVEQMGPPSHTNLSQNPNLSQNAVSLPPFPGRECSIDQESNNDPQSNLLFGVNIDNSNLLMQSGDSLTMPFTSTNYNMSNAGNGFSMNPTMTNPSSCIDESGFLQSPENTGQTNPPTRNFVKVISFNIC